MVVSKTTKLIHFPFFVSLSDYWRFTHAWGIYNKLKITRKRTAQWHDHFANEQRLELQMYKLWFKFTRIAKEELHEAWPHKKGLRAWWRVQLVEKGDHLSSCDSGGLDPALIHTISQNTDFCNSWLSLVTVICLSPEAVSSGWGFL